MREIRAGSRWWPFGLALVLAFSYRLHRRISEAVEVAKADKAVRWKMLSWVESVTEENCPRMEYALGREVAAQLQANGIPERPGSEGYEPETAADIPAGFASDFKSLPAAITDMAWDITRAVADSRVLRWRLLVWAKFMQRSRSWSTRWTAIRILEGLKCFS